VRGGGLDMGSIDGESEAMILENKRKIAELRGLVKEMEGEIISSRPFSRDILPPVVKD